MRLLYRQLCVSDLSLSARFYDAVFGFRPANEAQLLAGPDADRALEASGVRVSVLCSRNSQGIELRLARFDRPGPIGPRNRRPMNLFGLTHLNFYVRDFEATLADIPRYGGQVVEQTRLNAPVAPGVDSSMIYCTDPDGIRIEVWTTNPYGTGNPMATGLPGVDRKFSHSGVCVADPARSLEFYRQLGLQGAEIFDYRDYPGALDRVVELDGTRLFAQMMRDSAGNVVELLQFAAPSPVGTAARPPANQLGFSTLVFEVDDLTRVADSLVAAGGRAFPASMTSLSGHDLMQCSDPDGVRITLLSRAVP